MAKTKKEKKVMVESYKTRISQAKGFVVVQPKGLLPNETNELRKELFDFDSQFSIVKNSVFKIALKESNLPEIASLESGEHAVLFFSEDMVSPSKTFKKFIENSKTKAGDAKVVVVGGYLEGNLLTVDQVNELADMPDKRGSVAMILGILDNAIAGVLNVLEDAPRAYVSVLDQAFKE